MFDEMNNEEFNEEQDTLVIEIETEDGSTVDCKFCIEDNDVYDKVSLAFDEYVESFDE